MSTGMVKEMLFKGQNKGTSKKSGNAFHMITLHDPTNLENSDFFIRPENPVSAEGLKLKDKVVATFDMEFQFGRPQFVLTSLKKVQ